jgi:hypothetical protein
MKGEKKMISYSVSKNILLPKINTIQEENNKEANEDNSSIKENSKMDFSDSSDKINENEDNSYMEKQLSLLLEVFLTTYSKKTYQELIKDIEEKEILLYSNSIMSFKIMILKIKCLTIILLDEYNKLLQSKIISYHEIDNVVQKIQFEFKKLSNMLINNNSYEYEIMTQIYCKFLYLLSKISLKKEDNIKSLGFISLGINMLKVFIIRKKIANDIQTYKIYCKLLLLLINTLIGDNNYDQALLYCRLLLKIIEISQKFIKSYNQDNNNQNKISPLTSKKFIKYAGYTFLYIGCCLEQIEEDLQAFESYKQAKYFLDKGSVAGNPFKNVNIVSINNSCNFFAIEIFERMNLKFQKEKIENMQRQKKLDKIKKLQKYQLMQNEKQIRLKLISNGYIGDPFKYNKLEEKLYKRLFPTSIQNDLDKIDDELMSFVFTYYNKNNMRTPYRNKISSNTKKLISRYELYNILMSKEFRDFVMKNKKLQFNNPKKGSESISIIQRYLNNKMEIKFEMKQRSNTHKKTVKNLEKSNKSLNLLNLKIKNKENDGANTITFPTTCPNSNRDEEKEDKYTLNTQNNINNKDNNIKLNFNFLTLGNKEENYTSRNERSKGSPLIRITSKSRNMTTSKKKSNWKNNLNELECDFERKNFDKNLMTKNYLKKYSYYQKLSDKEIKLQKALLDFRNNNTLYNSRRILEDKEAKVITKEDIIDKFNVIREKVKENTKVVVKDEELEMLKDSFISGDENKISVKMKSAMSKVISQYIKERKKINAKKNYKMMNNDEIKQINEKNILELNYSIKNINNNISHIRILAGNKISDKIYN